MLCPGNCAFSHQVVTLGVCGCVAGGAREESGDANGRTSGVIPVVEVAASPVRTGQGHCGAYVGMRCHKVRPQESLTSLSRTLQ